MENEVRELCSVGCPELNRGNGVTTSDHIPPVGNRLTQTRSGDIQDHGLITYSYNAGDELLTETLPKQTNTYNYDANGNTIKRIETRLPGPPNPNPPKNKPYVPPAPQIDEFAFTWDHENRLVGYDAPGPSKDSTYTYYADWWNRTAKTVNRRTERYLYDGDEILCDYDKNGSFAAMYVNGPIIDERLALLRHGELYYYLTDHLGSVRQLIDTAGNIKNSYDYEAFGRMVRLSVGVDDRYGFCGRDVERESDASFHRFRYYLALQGRFLSVDPREAISVLIARYHLPRFMLPFAGESWWEREGYVYVQNSPLKWKDPMGRQRHTLIYDSTFVETMFARCVRNAAFKHYAKLILETAFDLGITLTGAGLGVSGTTIILKIEGAVLAGEGAGVYATYVFTSPAELGEAYDNCERQRNWLMRRIKNDVACIETDETWLQQHDLFPWDDAFWRQYVRD